MEELSFTYVPPEGLASFNEALGEDAWGAIDTTPWEGPNQTAAQPLGDAPRVVGHKLRLKWGLATLVSAIEGAGSAKDCDKTWDATQKQLHSLIAAATSSKDPAKREAAHRLQKSLLLGAGEAQTKLKYQQEVDFGRQQALLTSKGQGAADVALIGLSGIMAEIAQATDALAVAIGYGESTSRPFERLEAAKSACAASFAAVAEQLGWEIEHAQPGADRERAVNLRAPLEKLVARYPAPAPTAVPLPGAGAAANGGSTASAGGGAGTSGSAPAANGGSTASPGGGEATPGNGTTSGGDERQRLRMKEAPAGGGG